MKKFRELSIELYIETMKRLALGYPLKFQILVDIVTTMESLKDPSCDQVNFLTTKLQDYEYYLRTL